MRYRFICLLLLLALGTCLPAAAVAQTSLGTRLELLADDAIIDRLQGDARRELHSPEPQEVVLVTDKPWEGNTSAYYSIFRDGNLYRMYYRGSHFDTATRKATHPEVTCYAESKDGIHWTKPNLGQFEFDGSTENNIVWDGIGTHCFTPFKDANPETRKEAQYKALARGRPRGDKGLYAFKSPDGIHWSLMSDTPVITEGAFDSQNLAFWDTELDAYREYHRTFTNGVRAIMTGTSDDFLNWTKPELLEYVSDRNEHLYTNAIRPYDRAPHILVGFPTRFLPDEGQRVEPIFMSSRDGRKFRRYAAPVIPEDAPADRSGNRSNYMAWGLVQLPGDEQHYSVYATEAYYEGPDSRVRRFTYRVDGFVSIRGGADGGGFVTKPVTFSGKQLRLNLVCQPGGSVRVEIQAPDGKAIDGFAASDCQTLSGDSIGKPVVWKSGADLAAIAGMPVRVRFQLKSADLFSFQFAE